MCAGADKEYRKHMSLSASALGGEQVTITALSNVRSLKLPFELIWKQATLQQGTWFVNLGSKADYF